MISRVAVLIAITGFAVAALAPRVLSQEAGLPTDAAVTPAAPSAQTTAGPAWSLVTPDTDIFRRTPVIDGIIEDGEWDRFYSCAEGDWQVDTFADWDSRNLYVAAKSNKPIDMLCVLDANDDGWFHGDENFEFRATRGPEGDLTLSVCRYESRNIKSPVATPVTDAEAKMVELKGSGSADCYAIEMRVPIALIRGFKPAAGKKIGFQVNVKYGPEESGWVPSKEVGDVRHCVLVTKKMASLKPLVLGFDLKDAVIARGEELVGRFHLTNSGTETLDARTYVIAGEGRAGAYLNSERIRIEGLAPKKHISREFRTVVPTEMPVGSWALGAEVKSADARLGGALISFDVVDPFEVELRLPSAEVRADVKDVTIQVLVKNNTRRPMRGSVKITLPVGWELWRNADAREFLAGPEGGVAFATFKAKPPLGEMGTVPVKVEVSAAGEKKTVDGKFEVVAP